VRLARIELAFLGSEPSVLSTVLQSRINSGMNTIDAASYIQAKLADIMKKYPANSISRREVVSTLPYDGEDIEAYAARVDRTVTATIFKAAAEAWEKMPELTNFTALNPFKMDPSRDEQATRAAAVTAAVQQSVADLT
jgi:hypothetical protein